MAPALPVFCRCSEVLLACYPCALLEKPISYVTKLSFTDDIIAQTTEWLEKAVIGLNLCPFAKLCTSKSKFVMSSVTSTPEALSRILRRELEVLAEANPEKIDTILLIHPYVLKDFLDFNDFLDVADGLLEELDLDGILQIANFHPDYQFADTSRATSKTIRTARHFRLCIYCAKKA
jgi:hypothetical protein